MAKMKLNLKSTGDPQKDLTRLGIYLAVGFFVLLPVAPPVGLVWCIVVGKALFDNLKKQEIVKKNVEGKMGVDWNRAKVTGKKAADDFRTYSRDSAQRYKDRVSERGIMEEKQSYRHPHTPVNYSYDACARERRLEQIKSLKDAGILDEAEYQVRKARILAGK